MSTSLTLLCNTNYSAVAATSCQAYPSEYSYQEDSVTRAETTSANCTKYPPGLDPLAKVHTEHFSHCSGTQLKVTDSNLGSEQYSPSNYYVWPPGTRRSQLLFIFPTRINLTTITLHYYSDGDRGLPRLRFYTVPDDFAIWELPTVSHNYTEVAAQPPGEPAAVRSASTNFVFNTTKVLMSKYSSTFHFAVSEVEFFTCKGKQVMNITCT